MPQVDFALLSHGTYHDMLWAGLRLSLTLWALSLLLALPLALAVALLRLSTLAILRGLGSLFVESIRNVPLLAHMLFWYFAVPELLPRTAREWLYAGNYEATAATAALVLYAAAFMAEEIRSGVRAVPTVQLEAARALGLSHPAALRWVILPQAVRVIIPPLLSQALNLWKNTSIATVIGVAELMGQAAKVESATFHSFEPFLFATASYLTVSLIIGGVASGWHRHFPVRTP
jgi:polar amino acid transport system permease protein